MSLQGVPLKMRLRTLMSAEPALVWDKMMRSERNDSARQKTELEMEVSSVAEVKDSRSGVGMGSMPSTRDARAEIRVRIRRQHRRTIQ